MNQPENEKIVACIIARMKSVRLPRKSLADIFGKPMTLRLIERLQSSKNINQIVICTSTHPDDEILVEKAKEWGVEVIQGSEEDVLSRLILAAEKFNASAVLRVTGDNVLTCPENIDRMIERHKKCGADYTRTNNLPLGVTAEVMATSMLQPLHDLMPDPNQSEYMSFFSFDPENFFCLALEPPEEERRPYYSVTVDNPEDLELIRFLYKKYYRETGPRISEVARALDEEPEKCSISPQSPIKLPGGKSMTFENLLKLLDDTAEKARTINRQKKRQCE